MTRVDEFILSLKTNSWMNVEECKETRGGIYVCYLPKISGLFLLSHSRV